MKQSVLKRILLTALSSIIVFVGAANIATAGELNESGWTTSDFSDREMTAGNCSVQIEDEKSVYLSHSMTSSGSAPGAWLMRESEFDDNYSIVCDISGVATDAYFESMLGIVFWSNAETGEYLEALLYQCDSVEGSWAEWENPSIQIRIFGALKQNGILMYIDNGNGWRIIGDMTSAGNYTSFGLKNGDSYTYTNKMTITKNGTDVTVKVNNKIFNASFNGYEERLAQPCSDVGVCAWSYSGFFDGFDQSLRTEVTLDKNAAGDAFVYKNEEAYLSGCEIVNGNIVIDSVEDTAFFNLFSLFGQEDVNVRLYTGEDNTAQKFRMFFDEGWIEADITDGFGVINVETLGVGDNTVKIASVNDGEVLVIERIEVPFRFVSDNYTRYEAESARLNNVQIKGKNGEYDYGVYSGFGFVGNIDYESSYLRFDIEVPVAGEYEIRLSYAVSSTITGNPTINYFDGEIQLGTFTCTCHDGWGMFSGQSVASSKIMLNVGVNTITFKKGSFNAEIDYIEVGKTKIGDYKKPSSDGNKNEFGDIFNVDTFIEGVPFSQGCQSGNVVPALTGLIIAAAFVCCRKY
ncbi:MAG: hypothetical protein ACI4S9_09280 [Christensenellales bacterium]